MREYGRNIQRMVKYLGSVEDKEKRNSYAKTLVQLMTSINPNVKDSQEYEQKVWDDLYIISHFQLDVEGPFPKPDSNILDRKPDRVLYNSNEIKYRHYGRSIEILIEQAKIIEDPSEKESAIITIGKLMKSFYQTWNKEHIEDEQVLKNIQRMSDGELTVNIETVKELKLFDMAKREKSHDGKRRNGGGGQRGGKGKRRRRN